jgi:predicted 3-demethylubiquinone-9 3-methyltransferase (glyoxalase superfamily)
MKGIDPFLWFDDQAEDAAKRNVSIYSSLGSSDSQVTDVTRYGAAGAEAAGRQKLWPIEEMLKQRAEERREK